MLGAAGLSLLGAVAAVAISGRRARPQVVAADAAAGIPGPHAVQRGQ